MAEEKKVSLLDQIRSLPANFWVACFMEILERLAFFGVRAVAPLYLVASIGENGLDLTYIEKGNIYSIWALLQCLIPMVSGGYTDRYGYKKSLAVAFVINIAGYLLMAQAGPIAARLTANGWAGANFWVFMAAACLVATGTAIFKPPAHGTIARATDDNTSSMGWGIFYWVVNIGGALAPMCAAPLRGQINWHYVFYAAAIVTALNFLPMLFLYKEPPKPASEGGETPAEGPFRVFASSIATMFKDVRLVIFLAIFSCFWLMFMQLWDLLPNFINEWVDTSDVAPYFAWVSERWVLPNGQTKPEIIINIDSWAIILLVLPISKLVGKINKVAAMVIGMIIALIAFVGTGSTMIGVVCCLAVFVFSIGEMACSPTFNAYVGLIAPADKKALYMGYSNVPFAVGWALGNKVGGVLYETMANKFHLAREYLVSQLGMSPEFATDPKLLPNGRVMEFMTWAMKTGNGPALEEKALDALHKVDLETLPLKDQPEAAIRALDSVLNGTAGIDTTQATQILWDMHHPYVIWYYLGAIGLIGTLGMIGFYFVTRKSVAAADVTGEAAGKSADASAAEKPPRACPYCAHENPGDAGFCAQCGKSI